MFDDVASLDGTSFYVRCDTMFDDVASLDGTSFEAPHLPKRHHTGRGLTIVRRSLACYSGCARQLYNRVSGSPADNFSGKRVAAVLTAAIRDVGVPTQDRKSTRLNSSHLGI